MKNKFNLKKIIFCIIAFSIPILIIEAHIVNMELMNGNYFNNGENFLIADMGSQYNSIYAYIWDVLKGNASIFYSFGKSLGGNMASTIGYYAGSPLNFMYIFCKKADIPVMTFIIYLIKIGLSSLFMYTFLNYKVKKDKYNLIFSIMYALMAYNVNYYFNNMWLDVIMLAPLIIMGIDKLIEKKSILLYVITLTLAIISNFYIAYMMCIFCLIYFIYQLFIKYKPKQFNEYKNIIFRFIFGSLIAVGISLMFLLPEVFNLKEIMRDSINRTDLEFELKMLPKQFINIVLPKIYIGSHNTTSVLSRVRPNIYSGMLSLVLLYFYFLNKNFKLREKVISGLILLFYLISFISPHLNLLWQAGTLPNGYVCRYSFTFSLFIIYLSTKTFMKLDKIKLKYFIIFIIIFLLMDIIVLRQELVFIENSDIIITTIFVITYLIIIYSFMNIKEEQKNQLAFVTFLIVMIELFINFKLCFITNDDLKVSNDYKKFYNDTCEKISNYRTDTGFYRIDGDYQHSYLDSWTCNVNTITSSLSTNSGSLYSFWKENGGNITYTTIIYDMNKLPIFDSIFGVKYIKSNTKLKDPDYKLYDKIPVTYNNKKTYKYIYENPYVLSLGFVIPKDYKNIYNNIKTKDSVDSINRLMKTLSGNDEDVLIKYNKEYLDNGEYKFNINNGSDYIYLSFDYEIYTNWKLYDSIYINDEYVVSSQSYNVGNIKIKNKYKNSIIKVSVKDVIQSNNHDNLEIYYIDMDVFKKDIYLMKKNQLTNIIINGNKVTGIITADEDSVLFTSIPYEKGWKVYIDGKKENYEKVVNEFIGIKLTKGKHKIEMIYYPHHLGIGIIITIISILELIIYEMFIKVTIKVKKKNKVN